MSEKIKLNIQPNASVYALFSRFNYKEWYALAEFVDNSTASYFQHEDELKKSQFDKLVVEINYDRTTDTITIEDNAYGMEEDDFKRAILLEGKGGIVSRNEFGYGLKTAATWFGKRWSVESTRLDSENKYFACIDIDEIVSSQKNDTDIIVSKTNYNEHYTKIVITKLNHTLSSPTIKKNIINILNSMYRRDLKSGNIEIIYNGTTLSFSDYPILNFRDINWKKDISISFTHNGRSYSASGFVGIMEPGGYEKTGFALFRHNRAIDCNFKPAEIFGTQAQTQISLKLFGELDMDSFDVNQTKDGFSWDISLRELFIEKLKNTIPEFIEVAKMSKKDREAEIAAKTSVIETIDKTIELEKPAIHDKQVIPERDIQPITYVESLEPKMLTSSKTEQTIKEFAITVDYLGKKYEIKWDAITIETKFLYHFSNDILTINLKHNFIKNINTNDERTVISKFILAYVLSEQKAKLATSSTGFVKASTIHNQLDNILSNLK